MRRKTPIPPELIARIGTDFILSSRNGVPYLKRYARPANPDTPAQRRARTALARAVHAWQTTGPAEQERWNRAARERGRGSGYNLFLKEFMARDWALPE
jgi:hypothetical protein